MALRGRASSPSTDRRHAADYTRETFTGKLAVDRTSVGCGERAQLWQRPDPAQRRCAFPGLHRDFGSSALPTPHPTGWTSNDAAGFAQRYGPHSRSTRYRAFDTGLRPRGFPHEAARLLPVLPTATRTGLTPASDDELTTRDHLHEVTSGLLVARTSGLVVSYESGDFLRHAGFEGGGHKIGRAAEPRGLEVGLSAEQDSPEIGGAVENG